jgi:two-component system, NarL family, response regulator YdfI
MIRVLVLAESAVVRAGLEAMLHASGRFDLARADGPLPDLTRLGSMRPVSQPDVVLAELTAKRLLLLNQHGDGNGSIPLVLLMDDVRRSDLVRAIHAGARAVLPLDAQPAEILAAIEAAAAGLTAFGPDELDLLIPANSAERDNEPTLEVLSGREIQVLVLMAQGLANKNIADRLSISEHTVKFHVSSILAKLGAASRTEAVTRGLKDGLLVI